MMARFDELGRGFCVPTSNLYPDTKFICFCGEVNRRTQSSVEARQALTIVDLAQIWLIHLV